MLSTGMPTVPAVRMGDPVLRPGQATVLHGDECVRRLVLLSGAATLQVGDVQPALCPQRAAWLPARTAGRLDCRQDAVLRELHVEPVPPGMSADLRGVEPTSLLLALLEDLRMDHARRDVRTIPGGHRTT